MICANIVADVIIRMSHDICSFMKSGSILLCSGIIEPREPEVMERDVGMRFKACHYIAGKRLGSRRFYLVNHFI